MTQQPGYPSQHPDQQGPAQYGGPPEQRRDEEWYPEQGGYADPRADGYAAPTYGAPAQPDDYEPQPGGGYGSPPGGYGAAPPAGAYGSAQVAGQGGAPQGGGYGSSQGGAYGSAQVSGAPQGGSYGSPQSGSYGPPQGGSYGAAQPGTYGGGTYGGGQQGDSYGGGQQGSGSYGVQQGGSYGVGQQGGSYGGPGQDDWRSAAPASPYPGATQADPYGAPRTDSYGAPRTDSYGGRGADSYGAAAPGEPFGGAQQGRFGADPYAGSPPPGDLRQAPGAEPPRSGTNGFAIASLIFGVLGGVLFSVIFGIVALIQTKRRQQKGRGLAIAGLTLSGLWVVLIVVLVAVAILSGADRNEAGDITDSGSVSSFDLKPGDCLNGLTESQNISSLPAVPCAQPHEGEVFATFNVTAGDWPGDAAIQKQAEEGCVKKLPEYAPKAANDDALEIFFLHPTEQSWSQGDHEVTCVAMDPKKRTGSLKD